MTTTLPHDTRTCPQAPTLWRTHHNVPTEKPNVGHNNPDNALTRAPHATWHTLQHAEPNGRELR